MPRSVSSATPAPPPPSKPVWPRGVPSQKRPVASRIEGTAEADGTVSIKTYDSGGATYRSWFPAFQRINHTGTLTLPDGTTTIPYRAYRQTP